MTARDLYSFLEDLAANNNREWFAANRDRYDAVRAWWLGQVQILIDHLGQYDPSVRHVRGTIVCLPHIPRHTLLIRQNSL